MDWFLYDREHPHGRVNETKYEGFVYELSYELPSDLRN